MKTILSTSPRTGAWGLVAAIGAFLSLALFQIPGVDDAIAKIHEDAAVWVKVAGGMLATIALWGMGHDARDNAVTSEQARAK